VPETTDPHVPSVSRSRDRRAARAARLRGRVRPDREQRDAMTVIDCGPLTSVRWSVGRSFRARATSCITSAWNACSSALCHEGHGLARSSAVIRDRAGTALVAHLRARRGGPIPPRGGAHDRARGHRRLGDRPRTSTSPGTTLAVRVLLGTGELKQFYASRDDTFYPDGVRAWIARPKGAPDPPIGR
jgi:hypothetical protein